jgi:NADH-quinone oxidoreductase subunit N
MNLMANLVPAAAEIFLLVMICFILIVDLMLTRRGKIVTYLLVQLTLLGCSLVTVGTHDNNVVYAFNGMYVDDLMSDVLKMLSYLGMSMMLVYSRQYLLLRGLFTGEFMVLALFALLGMNALFGT